MRALFAPAKAIPEVHVGSKQFTESVILGEIATQLIRQADVRASHSAGLGGTRMLWSALLSGDIDAYPEYTSTLAQEIFSGEVKGSRRLRTTLRQQGVLISRSLGFNDTYAIGMLRERARQLGVHTISDLASHPNLKFGFSNEFMDRADGWPGLRACYDLPQTDVRGLDHDLAYRALASGDIDATDLYSTDAEIRYYDLIVLKDDHAYFPRYEAVWLYRAGLARQAPSAPRALRRVEGRISRAEMTDMNARVKLDGMPPSEIAAEFLMHEFGIEADVRRPSMWADIMRHTREHLVLVLVSLTAAVIIAIPLGIAAARMRRLGQVILSVTGIIQTIPALALLVFMIPWLGIGGPPAIVALFLYSLLPIVRNTYTGLREISPEIRESAEALGLPAGSRLRLVELPIAIPTILAGIKTSAIINIGTATLGALIGAGGYGQPILTGIRLDDMGLILQGAVPAALLALVVQGLFELAERYLSPKGLRPGIPRE
ncbi:MAG TPA: glycine betaine ABC transporter substrate-binding protein [Gammaproteobacteria bacterium]|nr:glycine betaine ABC transporter substrate-binding protein [Gammaproteobacteria bacterium]